jgi:hypothetical protein
MRFRCLGQMLPGFRLALLLVALIGLALLALLAAAPAVHAQAPGYTDVSAGHLFTCAVKADGDVACWGLNLYDEAPESVTGPFKQVSAGGWVGCGLRLDGTLTCWGDDGDYGEGNATPPGGTFSQVSVGWDHSCGLRTNNTVDCWGQYNQGFAVDPDGAYLQVSAGMQHSCAIVNDSLNNAHCWGWNDNGRAQDYPGAFKQISAGGYHNCGVRKDGTVACWGAGTTRSGINYEYGQSIPPSGTFIQVAAGQLHTCGIRTDGTLTCWGYNLYGQVGKAPDGTFKQVTSGLGHSCAISTGGGLYCWGRNDFGQTKIPNLGGPIETFAWEGFYPPVEAAPVPNMVKAGGSVPLKFGLGGDKGLQVIAEGFPASVQFDCARREPAGDPAATKTAGGSSLSYDPASGAYTYAWKTDKTWAGTCRALVVKLADDTWHVAGFRFK